VKFIAAIASATVILKRAQFGTCTIK
jgi:hypothetical protein